MLSICEREGMKKKWVFVDLCGSVCDMKTPEGSVNGEIWECRTKSEMSLLPSPVATKN